MKPTTTPIPCPLNEAHCQQLDTMIATIPQIQAIVADCPECEAEIPGVTQQLADNLALAKRLREMYMRSKGT